MKNAMKNPPSPFLKSEEINGTICSERDKLKYAKDATAHLSEKTDLDVAQKFQI